MSAREIKKLIEIGYIRKEADQVDSRAYKLFLTEKAKLIIPDIKKKLLRWNELITQSLSEQEKAQMIDLLSIVVRETKNQRIRQKVEG
jgi:DNA-binding MarR family transcriptional regulator